MPYHSKAPGTLFPMASIRDQFQNKCTYQVFLSFRGKDTRNTFTSHLYKALIQAGIHTFRDNQEITRGEQVKGELTRPIQDSKISIVIFSENYASSGVCLDELANIMERRKNMGQKVLPVFYHIQPSQVREQSGSFTEALAKHETEAGKKEKVQKWREALREAASLAGMVLQEQDEANFIEGIVDHVRHSLKRKILRVPSHLVGIESHVKAINYWLSDFSNELNILILHGLGGVGKTTVAKAVYNMNYENFEGSSFIAEIRKIADEPRGLVRMQQQLVRDLMKGKKEVINNVDEGIVKIQEVIYSKRFFIVLDDIELKDHFDAIIPAEKEFFLGSKIIITTRNMNILRSCRKFWRYKVTELDHEKSLQLFSWHAFGKENLDKKDKSYSEFVVKHCGGLPLALEVLGSSLSGKCEDIWKNALENLKIVDSDKKIDKILKISYDNLSHAQDKNVFLDIVCFFVGKNVDYVIKILDGCGYQARYRLEVLMDRSLVTIDHQNKLMVHQLVQDMGREIIYQESPNDLGKRSRIWHNDAYFVLREKTGTEAIKGLALNIDMLKEDKDAEGTKRHHGKHSLGEPSTLLHREDYCKRQRIGFLSWKTINFLWSSVRTSSKIELETKAFARMCRLNLIKFDYVKLKGDFKTFPKSLVWLFWCGFPLESIPDEFYLDNLVALDMRQSNLQHMWKRTRVLKNLKILNLSHSHSLLRTPDLSGLVNLETLKLKECINLLEIHESIAKVKTLFQVNLKNCKSLKYPTCGFHNLKSLETLILSGCWNLHFEELMEDIGKLESLKVLDVDGISTNKHAFLANKRGNLDLISRKIRRFLPWALPRNIPDEFPNFSLASLPRSLVQLKLANCNLSDNAIPSDLSCMPMLEELDLRGNLFHRLPSNFLSLQRLQSFDVSDCKELQASPTLAASIRFMNVTNSKSLVIVTNLQNVLTSLRLQPFDLLKLPSVRGLFGSRPIQEADLEFITNTEMLNLDLESIRTHYMFEQVMISPAIIKSSPQMLYECGIYSIFVPGSEIPHWYNTTSKGESVLFFVVPSHPNSLCIQGLNICVVYDCPEGFPLNLRLQCFLEVINESRNLKWIYTPMSLGFRNQNDMLWVSHWQHIANQLEGGDRVRVSVDLSSDYRLKKFGIHFVHGKERSKVEISSCEDKIQQYVMNRGLSSVDDRCRISLVDVSAYCIGQGVYDLCNSTLTVEDFLKLGTVISGGREDQIIKEMVLQHTSHRIKMCHRSRCSIDII